MSSLTAENLLPLAESIETAHTTVHEFGMFEWSVHLPFEHDARAQNRLAAKDAKASGTAAMPKKPETIYQAVADAMGIDWRNRKRAPEVVQRTCTLAALHFSRAAKVTKGGTVSTTTPQFMDEVFNLIVGPSASDYHYSENEKNPLFPTISKETEGVTAGGVEFFQISTGKAENDKGIRTWEGCASAVQAIVNGLRTGETQEVVIVDRDDKKVEAYRFTLSFKHEYSSASAKRS